MRKLLLGATALLALGTPALAADMAVKAPLTPQVVAYNWSGFYVGINVGGAWNDTRDSISPSGCFINPALLCGGPLSNNPLRSDSVRLSGSGFTGGGQAGYNWQSANFVFGIEGDINYLGINDTNSINRALAAPLAGNIVHSETDKMGWFGTLRGRVGFTVSPSFLLYGTGGLAFGQVRSASATAFTATTDVYAGSIDNTLVGWTVGAGGEWMIAPRWSVKAEYLFVDLGKTTYTQTCITAVCTLFTPAPSYQTELHVRENIFRVGVNYKLDWAQPVVARY